MQTVNAYEDLMNDPDVSERVKQKAMDLEATETTIDFGTLHLFYLMGRTDGIKGIIKDIKANK